MTTITLSDGSAQIRRISWDEFWKIRPDLKMANDNRQSTDSNHRSHAISRVQQTR